MAKSSGTGTSIPTSEFSTSKLRKRWGNRKPPRKLPRCHRLRSDLEGSALPLQSPLPEAATKLLRRTDAGSKDLSRPPCHVAITKTQQGTIRTVEYRTRLLRAAHRPAFDP